MRNDEACVSLISERHKGHSKLGSTGKYLQDTDQESRHMPTRSFCNFLHVNTTNYTTNYTWQRFDHVIGAYQSVVFSASNFEAISSSVPIGSGDFVSSAQTLMEESFASMASSVFPFFVYNS